MSQYIERYALKFFLHHAGEPERILCKELPAALRGEVAQVLVADGGISVSQVVVTEHSNAVCAEKGDKILVPFDVLAHSVDYLQNRSRL